MARAIDRFCQIDARHRALIAFVIAVAAWFVFSATGARLPSRAIGAWDSFAVSLLVMTWTTMFHAEHTHIRRKAQSQDLSRTLIFFFTVVAAFASLFAVIFLLSSIKITSHLMSHAALAVVAIISGWSLMHTVFALRYAHVYYGDSENPKIHAGGLDFPGDKAPNYLDFAYFSFIIGMTCQVSDVQITSKRLRRLALAQGALSFGFNTVILALTVNAVAGLL
jgi:uncharacterized membrane protein